MNTYTAVVFLKVQFFNFVLKLTLPQDKKIIEWLIPSAVKYGLFEQRVAKNRYQTSFCFNYIEKILIIHDFRLI